jgi:tetratricopeptide (TPR) repeat protein
MTVPQIEKRIYSASAQNWAICCVLACVTLADYWPVRHYEFVNFDDLTGIVNTPQINSGLTWRNIVWAFRSTQLGNWQPLTSISAMLDCQFFGLNPGPPHLENVLFHAADSVLLFLALHQLTGSRWRSAFVAALFAWHPLHVESVAWISERKDVLSSFFWMLTLLAYGKYTGHRSKFFYLLTIVFFALGLMSKPMLVTLPFALLLLDFWPLNRIANLQLQLADLKSPAQPAPLSEIVREKIPFFALSLAMCCVTFLAQAHTEAVVPLANLPFASRIANALIAYQTYVQKMFWPRGLAVYYPMTTDGLAWRAALAAIFLILVSAAFFRERKQRPYLLVGWLWFLGTLVPVIGIVQVGLQAMADRYSYIPLIGLFILLAWSAGDICTEIRAAKFAATALAAVALLVCLVLTRSQLKYWQNSIALFSHSVEVRPDSPLIQNNLAGELISHGQFTEAAARAEVALRLKPDYTGAHVNLGRAYVQLGRETDARMQFTAALKDGPDADACHYLGDLDFKQGRFDTAKENFAQVARLLPNSAEAHNNLGLILDKLGDTDAAAEQFATATRLAPDFSDAQCNLAFHLAGKGDISNAISHYQAALRTNNNLLPAQAGLAKLLDDQGDWKDAAAHFAEVMRLRPDFAPTYERLADALARQGKFDEAARVAETGINAAEASSQPSLTQQLRDSLQRYRDRQP